MFHTQDPSLGVISILAAMTGFFLILNQYCIMNPRLCMVKFCLMLGVIFLYSASVGQSLNGNWEKDLMNSFNKFLDCTSTTETGLETCGVYTGESLSTVYQLKDFYSKSQGRYLVATEIAKFLEENKQWTVLGHAYEQTALVEAQKQANEKKAVVAVYLDDDGLGHTALILPGELQQSGSWRMRVPNSSSFFATQPDKSYVGKGLSYAFVKNMIKDVLIYARKY